MNVVFILMDSLNRHFLNTYGNEWVKTPNIDRLAARSVVFDKHYIGSMPCMPARHDIWTGKLEFLWRPWGPVDPGEVTLPMRLRGKVVTQLVTDHYHFFERGGETYHVDFDGWEFIRGHENDPWVTQPNDIPLRNCWPRYRRNMRRMQTEADFTSPRTFQAAADWLEGNHHAHEQFLLFIDEFDPHEPFHSSEPYNSMYDPEWDDLPFFWPTYGPNRYSEQELRHLRTQYAGKLTMADAWLGRVLDKLDQHNLWSDSLVILTTDHGHFLGEKDWVGKGTFPQYQPIAHIPLMIASPGVPSGRSEALTTIVDLAATVLDAFGEATESLDGRSILPLLRGEREKIRDWALFGQFGAYVQITDGKHVYLRAPESEMNDPLYIYRLTWNTAPWWGVPVPDERLEIGRFFPHDDRIVTRIQLNEHDKQRLQVLKRWIPEPTQLCDVEADPEQKNDLAGDAKLSSRFEKLLAKALKEVGCPPEQFDRLALTPPV
jgi:arylsulfatase A-like enzyme